MLDLADLHVKKLLDSRRTQQQSEVVARRQADRLSSPPTANRFLLLRNRRIAVIPADGGDAAHLLTEDFDENPNLIAWGPDGIYFTASRRPRATSSASTRHPRSQAHQRSRSLHIAGSIASPRTTGRWPRPAPRPTISPRSSSLRSATFAPQHAHRRGRAVQGFPPRHARSGRSGNPSDGTTIEGILIKPADYDATRKYPLLVVIHGGPTGVDTPVLRGGPHLSGRALRGERRADPEAELSRLGGLRREVPLAQRAQSRPRRLRGRDLAASIP